MGDVSVIDNFDPQISGELNYWDQRGDMHKIAGDGINPSVAFDNGASLADVISKYQNYIYIFVGDVE